MHVAGLPFERDFAVSGEGYVPEGEFRLKDRAVNPLEKPTLALLLLDCALCNDAGLQQEDGPEGKQWAIVGDPTEGALVTLAAKAGAGEEDAGVRV